MNQKLIINKLYAKHWVVYVKRPFHRPQQVIEYLGRYTHKVAISNYRIVKLTKTSVFFKWKDYRHANKNKVMELSIAKFIRRFALHILPHRYVRIRHYGLLSFKSSLEIDLFAAVKNTKLHPCNKSNYSA